MGLIFGSLFGGKLILKGRRRAIIVIQAMAVIASIFTCFRSLFLICLGRFIIAFVGSCSCLIMGKSIGETVPSSMTASYGMLLNIFINVGFLLCFLIGLLLPTDPADFEKDEMWMVVSIMPAFFGVATIFLWSLVFTEEPIAYSLANNQDDEAKRLLKRCYSLTTVNTYSKKSKDAVTSSNDGKMIEIHDKSGNKQSNEELIKKKLTLRRNSTYLGDEIK